jgi:recombination protein RecT
MKDAATKALGKQQNTNQAIEVVDKVKDIKSTLTKHMAELEASMLKKIAPEYLIQVAATILSQKPELQQCTSKSIITAVFQSAQCSLSLDPVLRHASLVPRWNDKLKCKEAQFMVEYRGYLELARRSGEIMNVAAHLVYENDFFEREFGSNEKLTHRPAKSNRGKIVGAYAYAKLKSGGFAMDYMTTEEINGIMKRSTSKTKEGKIVGAWVTDWGEMARKTLARRLAKYLPLSTEFSYALNADADTELDAVETTAQVEVPEAEVVTDEPPQQELAPTSDPVVDPPLPKEPMVWLNEMKEAKSRAKKTQIMTEAKKALDLGEITLALFNSLNQIYKKG